MSLNIACPKCDYEPQQHDVWTCACTHAWNTFDTHGQCPVCKRVWRQTQCPKCHAWSPHHDWYRDLPAIEVLEEALTEEQQA